MTAPKSSTTSISVQTTTHVNPINCGILEKIDGIVSIKAGKDMAGQEI